MRRSIRVLLLAALWIPIASIEWSYAHTSPASEPTVLDVPILFEPGFSITREFTVERSETYWVTIRYERRFRSTVHAPIPHDQFTAEYMIKSGELVVAKGGTAALPDSRAPWAVSRDHVTRYLGAFLATPGRKYSITLRIMNLPPGVIAKSPRLLVEIQE